MRRRDLLLLACSGVVSSGIVRAQQLRRIGFLRLAPADAAQLADFRAGIEETGYIDGRNLVIEYGYAEGDYARLPVLADELVRRKVEVIVTSGGPDAVIAAMRATSTIPIVGTSVARASRPFSIIKHHKRPERNVTGVYITTGDLVPKRLQILAELVPGAVIGVLVNPTSASHDRARAVIEDAGRMLNLPLVFAPVSTDADLDPAFASLAGHNAGAVIHEAEPFLGNSWRRLVRLAERYKIPMMQEWREAVAAGGLISYAPSFRWVMRQVGNYAGKILNGAKPADLPVIAPATFELSINLKTARALGLTVPQSLLARADEVIE